MQPPVCPEPSCTPMPASWLKPRLPACCGACSNMQGALLCHAEGGSTRSSGHMACAHLNFTRNTMPDSPDLVTALATRDACCALWQAVSLQ